MVGLPAARIDAQVKVTGEALYPGDLIMDGQVYMKVLFARRPHARILHIDPSAALSMPGVLAVLTARDVPVNHYGIEIEDQPVLCDREVRFSGDRVAMAIAESEEIAAQALERIKVEYEDLPVIDSPQAALTPGAPTLHPDRPDNVLLSIHVEKGDVEAGFAQADVVLEETYLMGAQEHAYLQPDAGLAWIDESGCLVVKTAGQWVQDDRRQIASSLGLPEERVRILYAHIGGAFGGREDINLQICLALAAWKVRRPVKAIWSREETTLGHPKRHPMQIRHRWGATRQGNLVAQQIEIIADAGAYASTSASVLGTAVILCTGPYEVPNMQVNARTVYTNNPISGAFRGFGAPQALFAAEAHMARLSAALGLDPVELRMRNLLSEGSQTGTMGRVPPGVSARETLEAAARCAGWEESGGQWKRPSLQPVQGKLRGVGIASGLKAIGYPLGWQEQATISIELQGEAEIERVFVHAQAAEVGQGVHTALCQMAAQALDLPLERVHIGSEEASFPAAAGPAAASRLTLVAGNAVIGAAEAALQAWKNEERPAVATYTYLAPPTRNFAALGEQGSAGFSIAYLAQAVTIEVDVETGHISVDRLISVHDVGKAINPQMVEGQVQGGAIQGLGWATMEDFIVQRGQVLTTELSTYLIPTVLDIPADFEILILEKPSPMGPWGATGVGEMPLLSIAPAIFDALHDATGAWLNQVPLTQERVWRCLHQK